jgi:hypothetical protein
VDFLILTFTFLLFLLAFCHGSVFFTVLSPLSAQFWHHPGAAADLLLPGDPQQQGRELPHPP